MRIGMILLSKFPPDIRVEKELNTLRVEHDVFMLCPRRGKQPAEEMRNGMEIHRIFSQAERWWSRWRLMATCYSSLWERSIGNFIDKCKPDVLHVHDLPLLGTVLAVAKRHCIPVVADLHENYPALLEEGLKLPLTRLGSLGSLGARVTVSVARWKLYEQSVVSQADQVITVIEEARDRLIRLGVPDAKIHVVANYDSRDEISYKDQQWEGIVDHSKPFRIVYAGGFGATRDLYTVVNAVSQLPARDYQNLEVQLIGGVGRELHQLRRYAKLMGVADRVSIMKWLPIEEAENQMAGANIGLVPHVKSPHTDTTVPHKLFQYMWRKLPVIVSNCAPLERIVKESSCGMVYPSGDATALAECISKLYDDWGCALRMGLAGHEAVKDRYNWDKAGETLLKVYQEV